MSFQTEKKPIDDASDDELRTFATDFLQLEDATGDRNAIIGALKKAWKQPHILVPLAAAPAADDELGEDTEIIPVRRVPKDIGGQRYQNDPKVSLVVLSTSFPGGDEPAPVSVNGSNNLIIPRNTPVLIPYRFYLALKNAHLEDVKQDPANGQIKTTRSTLYPLSDVELPPRKEIEAWHERVKDSVLN